MKALYLRVDRILEIGKKALDLQKTWRYIRKLQRYKNLTLKSKLGDIAKVENSVTENPGIEILPLQMQ